MPLARRRRRLSSLGDKLSFCSERMEFPLQGEQIADIYIYIYIAIVITEDTYTAIAIIEDTHTAIAIIEDTHIALVIIEDTHSNRT